MRAGAPRRSTSVVAVLAERQRLVSLTTSTSRSSSSVRGSLVAGAAFSTTRAPRCRARRASEVDFVERHFELHQHDGLPRQHRVGNLRGSSARVRAGDDRDAVLAAIVHMDQRDAGRRIACHTPARSTADCASARNAATASPSARPTHRRGARHHRRGARRAPDSRLCRRADREPFALQRLAGLRQARDARHEIEIDRAEDDDHRWHLRIAGRIPDRTGCANPLRHP